MKAGKILSTAVKVIVFIIIALLIWRVIFATDKNTLSDFVPTKASSDLYNANGSLTVLTNDVISEISDGGYFSVYGVQYVPDAKELQVTVRYNDSTVEQLGKVDFYAYTVDTSADQTLNEEGDGADSGESGERLYNGFPIGEILTPAVRGTDEKLFYNYEKLVFENVEIGDTVNVVVSLCAEGDSSIEYAAIAVHYAEQTFENYKMSGSEKNALSSYSE